MRTRIMRQGWVIPVDALNYLSSCCLSIFAVGEGIYVGSKACRGGCIDAGNMVVDTNLEWKGY